MKLIQWITTLTVLVILTSILLLWQQNNKIINDISHTTDLNAEIINAIRMEKEKLSDIDYKCSNIIKNNEQPRKINNLLEKIEIQMQTQETILSAQVEATTYSTKILKQHISTLQIPKYIDKPITLINKNKKYTKLFRDDGLFLCYLKSYQISNKLLTGVCVDDKDIQLNNFIIVGFGEK